MNKFNNKPKSKVESSIEFVEKYQENPISFFNKDINTETNFAITKLTENGKWMRGNMLYYSLSGVEIYTDPDNIIFVDTVNKTMFVKEYSKVIRELTPEDPEQKQYIILYTDIGYENNDEEFPLRWEAVQGRKNAYENIKVNATIIDIDKSIVVVETVPIKDSLTVREFVNYIKNADMVDEDDFDINSFAGTDYI